MSDFDKLREALMDAGYTLDYAVEIDGRESYPVRLNGALVGYLVKPR